MTKITDEIERRPALRGCKNCGTEKPLTAEFFSPHSESKHGFVQSCRVCKSAQQRKTPEEHRHRMARQIAESVNGEKVCRSCGGSYPLSLKCFYVREGYFSSRCRRCEAGRWHSLSTERKAAYTARIRERRAAKRALLDRAPKTKQAVKLRKLITVLINTRLKRTTGQGKGNLSWPTVLGYSADDLARHLERQFTAGMTWENRGTFWHIDHIVPVAAFNISSPNCLDFKACWALSNLRPLRAKQNRLKSDKRLFLI